MLSKNEFYESTAPGVYIYNAQPGTGKTRGLIEYIIRNSKKETPLRIGVFTNNHDHLTEIEKGIPGALYRHLIGFTKLCPRYKTDPDVKIKYDTYGNPKDNICETCGEKSGCQYLHQFKFLEEDKAGERNEDEDEIQVILSPLEFLSFPLVTNYVDQIFIDESVEKLGYYNIGINWQIGYHMDRAIRYIGSKNDINTKLLCKQIGRACEIITEFQSSILEEASLLKKENPNILENFNHKTYFKDEYVIQSGKKGNYITRPVMIKPVIEDKLRKMIHAFYANIDEYKKDLSDIIKADNENMLPSYFVNLSNQIDAIQKLAHIYKNKHEPIPVNINEKIEHSPIDTLHSTPYTSRSKADGTYLISTIGKQYTSDKKKPIRLQQDSYITFGVHMMHTVFELAALPLLYPVKLLDSSFNKTCFDKLYNESQNGKDEPVPVRYVEPLEIVRNPESHIYPVLTRKNKYRSNYSKTSQGVSDEHPPYAKCLRDIKDINAFRRQAKKEGIIVAMISFKDLEKYFWGVFGKKMLKHFGRFRGSNILEKADILIVYGTPFHPPKTFLFDYINTFHEFPKDTTSIKDIQSRFDGYVDKELNEFFQWHVMEEPYQAIHRIRILLHDKIVILFGAMPQRIIDNKECTIEKPQTFRSVQAEILDRKSYYLKNPEEARQALMPKPNYNQDMFRKSIQEGILVNLCAYEWDLSSEDIWEIMINGFKPIMNEILRCEWDSKKPIVDAVTESVYKKSRSSKRKKRGLKGHSRKEIYFAIALLEKQGLIEIKEVSLNNIYHDTKRGEGYLIEFKK